MADQIAFLPERVLTPAAMPGASYRVRFYESGTTTPKTVYTSAALSVAHPSPLLCDATGTFPAVFSAGGAIKAVITDSNEASSITLDPVLRVPTSVSGASDITFSPTVPLPFTNVQAAIEGAAASAATGFTPFGLGVTGTNALIANLDATGTASGSYRFDNTTTGTYPTGVAAVDTGTVQIWRENAGDAVMWLQSGAADRQFTRRLAASVWGAWREVITVDQGALQGDTIYRGASAWTRLVKGTARQLYSMNAGATAPEWVSDTSTTVGLLTTTGAATVGPWALPAGVKKFTVTSNKGSLNGAGNILVQLRVAGVFVTAGYESESLGYSSNNQSSTAGMIVAMGAAARFWRGSMSFWLHDPATNLWMCTHTGSETTVGDTMVWGSGGIALAGAVDGVQINSTAGTFDVSSFNVNY